MNLAKSYEFFQPEQCSETIHIIGCGAVGSTIAENLVRYGLTDIVLYDFDMVEPKNVANQIYTEEDIGRPKIEALADYLVRINPELKDTIRLEPEGWNGQRLSGYIFLAVDNIEIRQKIAAENKANMRVKGMFDFRMRLTDAQHYAADWGNAAMIRNFIASMDFSHDEAMEETPVSACNQTLSAVATIRSLVAYGVNNFIKFLKGEGIKKMVLVDMNAFTVDAF